MSYSVVAQGENPHPLNWTYENDDGLSYQNTSGGYLKIYKDNVLLRKFGFGITSHQANKSTASFDWKWKWDVNLSRFNAINKTNQFTWEINYSLADSSPMKVTHYVLNNWKNLTNGKYWYIFTINDDDTIKR